MDSNTHRAVEINLVDLLFVLLRRLGIALLVGIIVAGALFVYKYTSNTSDANALDIGTRLPGESDAAYSERVHNVNRAEDIINSIDALNRQIDNQRDYLSNSIVMQIDFTNEAVTSAQVVISVDEDQALGMTDSLYSAYSQDILSGDYLSSLADELGTEQVYLTELISVERDDTNSLVVNSGDSVGNAMAFTITVIGTSTQYTAQIMDCVFEEIDITSANLNSTVAPHTVSLIGKQSFYKVDNDTRDLQHLASNRSDTLQKQIDTYNLSLTDLATKIGINSKDNITAYFSYNDVSWVNSRPTMNAMLMFALKGFAVSVCAVFVVIAAVYVFGNKFSTQAKFFGRFPGLNKIGIVKPTNKRSVLVKSIDRITGDDDKLSAESSNRLLAANIANQTRNFSKVLFIGTAETIKIKALVDALGIKADVKESFFIDPANLENVSNYDGIVLVEQRKHSDCRMVAEEIRLIAKADTTLIGAIVI